jgi:hypothetical protein
VSSWRQNLDFDIPARAILVVCSVFERLSGLSKSAPYIAGI